MWNLANSDWLVSRFVRVPTHTWTYEIYIWNAEVLREVLVLVGTMFIERWRICDVNKKNTSFCTKHYLNVELNFKSVIN